MTDWIEHNGGPQPVDDDVWVEAYVALRESPNLSVHQARKATFVDWPNVGSYRILNQHLIDAKQTEIDQLRDDLETWQSVFPHVMPDRLKSDQQLAEENVAAKIDAALKRGIELGLEAAAAAVWNGALGGLSLEEGTNVIRNLNPDTIAREAVLDQLTSEAQADNMGYDND